MFGTDGVRRVIGAELNPIFVSELASALATYLEGAGPVLVAWDFRTSSSGIARILAGTLQMHGIDVVEMGPMPTPCMQFNVKALQARAGTMVTASHNPTQFNGIKFTGPQGLEIPREGEIAVEQAFHERRYPRVPWDQLGTIRSDPNGVDRYVQSIEANVERALIRRWGPRVILDCGNGTSAVTSPRMLRELGCRLTTLNANPDGAFPGHPSEPTEENLRDLAGTVVEAGAQLGIAHDGDSDRVAFIDERGKYIPGEVALGLFARNVLERNPKSTIVTSVTSSSCVRDVVEQAGGLLLITRSGSLPVADEIVRRSAAFGGEENGGYYWPAHQVARDGPMSSAKMLELLARERRPLSELVAELPHYHVLKQKTDLPPALKESVMARVLETLQSEADRVVAIDGVKAFYSDGWLLVRPSGTEPICRVFAESLRPEVAQRLVERGLALVRELVVTDEPHTNLSPAEA